MARDDEPVSLAAIRATKAGNGRLWSVEDALREALRMIKNAEITPDLVYIALRERHHDKPALVRYPSFVAGEHNLAEVVGLLEIHIIRSAQEPTEDD